MLRFVPHDYVMYHYVISGSCLRNRGYVSNRDDFVPVLHPEVSNDGSNCEAAEIWLDTLASLPHVQTMVEHMVYHSGPNLIRDDHFPSFFSSSSSFFSLSFSSSSSLSSYSSSPCPRPSCPPLPPPLTLTPLLLWLLISSKRSEEHTSD